MKKNLFRRCIAVCMAGAMLMGTAVTASAAQPDYSREIEAMEKWLNGLTVTRSSVSASNNSQSGSTQSSTVQSSTAASTQKLLTAEELAAYADKIFELVNIEREKAGASPLTRSSILDEAAMIRAAEIKTVDNLDGAPHTRPDGTGYRSLLEDMGIASNRCGENITRAKPTPQDAMNAWMDSEGHRRNILRENYGSIGIGVYQRPDGKLDWIQIFELN